MATELELKIILEVEYYFSNRGGFMQSEIRGDDGWIELKVLLKSPKLTRLSTDTKFIAAALRKSKNCIVVVSDDGEKIRRNPYNPVYEPATDYRQEIWSRKAYVKGFPKEDSREAILKNLKDFRGVASVSTHTFMDEKGQVQSRGGATITFENQEACESFISFEKIEYKDQPLIRRRKADWVCENKLKRMKERKLGPIFPKDAILHFYGDGVPNQVFLTNNIISKAIVETNLAEPLHIEQTEKNEGYVWMPGKRGGVDFINKLADGMLPVGDFQLKFDTLNDNDEYFKKNLKIMNLLWQYLQ